MNVENLVKEDALSSAFVSFVVVLFAIIGFLAFFKKFSALLCTSTPVAFFILLFASSAFFGLFLASSLASLGFLIKFLTFLTIVLFVAASAGVAVVFFSAGAAVVFFSAGAAVVFFFSRSSS